MRFGNGSFAQKWSNLTGGNVLAATGKNNNTGRTDYIEIFPDERNIIQKFSKEKAKREIKRAETGYSQIGCENYPTVTDGGYFNVFMPQKSANYSWSPF